jgi:hypothetical protein
VPAELAKRNCASSISSDKAYVNVSDGGHFENLGIYELVRRRCRYIVACDGEQDGGLKFEGLAGAIRKCRTDFGVGIDIDTDRIRLKNGFSQAHCVVGRIKYPHDDRPAYLLCLKSSLTGNEDTDVLQYRSTHPEFPHQSTADQWFDESQFATGSRVYTLWIRLSEQAEDRSTTVTRVPVRTGRPKRNCFRLYGKSCIRQAMRFKSRLQNTPTTTRSWWMKSPMARARPIWTERFSVSGRGRRRPRRISGRGAIAAFLSCK